MKVFKCPLCGKTFERDVDKAPDSNNYNGKTYRSYCDKYSEIVECVEV